MDEIDVSKCQYKSGIECHISDYPILNCVDVNIEYCHYKQLQQSKQENKKLKSYLNKIREEELSSLDIEWDEYQTGCRTTDYSNIVTLVEEALGENND